MSAAPGQTLHSLSDLEVGAIARIVDAAVDAEARTLLRALGLTDDSRLRVCKRGEPCVVQVRDTRIGISGRIAQLITVAPEPGSPQGSPAPAHGRIAEPAWSR